MLKRSKDFYNGSAVMLARDSWKSLVIYEQTVKAYRISVRNLQSKAKLSNDKRYETNTMALSGRHSAMVHFVFRGR